MKIYRMSSTFIFFGLIIGAIVASIFTIGRPHPFATFAVVEGIFSFFALLSWASTAIFFDGDKIVRRSFFLSDTPYPIRDIKRVRFDRNEDSFGGLMPTVTIEFSNGKRIMLINFRRADINAILEKINTDAPGVDVKGVVKDVEENEKRLNDWRSAYRPGDTFLFGAGLLIVILFIVWWLFQEYLIS